MKKYEYESTDGCLVIEAFSHYVFLPNNMCDGAHYVRECSQKEWDNLNKKRDKKVNEKVMTIIKTTHSGLKIILSKVDLNNMFFAYKAKCIFLYGKSGIRGYDVYLREGDFWFVRIE